MSACTRTDVSGTSYFRYFGQIFWTQRCSCCNQFPFWQSPPGSLMYIIKSKFSSFLQDQKTKVCKYCAEFQLSAHKSLSKQSLCITIAIWSKYSCSVAGVSNLRTQGYAPPNSLFCLPQSPLLLHHNVHL